MESSNLMSVVVYAIHCHECINCIFYENTISTTFDNMIHITALIKTVDFRGTQNDPINCQKNDVIGPESLYYLRQKKWIALEES